MPTHAPCVPQVARACLTAPSAAAMVTIQADLAAVPGLSAPAGSQTGKYMPVAAANGLRELHMFGDTDACRHSADHRGSASAAGCASHAGASLAGLTHTSHMYAPIIMSSAARAMCGPCLSRRSGLPSDSSCGSQRSFGSMPCKLIDVFL